MPEALREWTDVDIALFELGRALGVLDRHESFNQVKGMLFWGAENPLGKALHDTLRVLVTGGILEEKPDDPGMYRWSAVQPSRLAT